MEQTCAEWCRSHYWQLQEKRGWRYAFHESVMVRYYEEANLDTSLLEPLVEFLKSEAWRDSFTVHNKPMDATGWKTTAVWYETRDGDVKEATKLKRTRIYHAIYKEGAQGGDGPYVMEDGCKWRVTHEFHWKVGSLPALPESASGVQYRLQGVARDEDTGLWNCVIERRETVQQDIAEYGTAKTVFENRSEEQHLGVKQGSVAGTGKPASVGGGVMVRRQLRKNEDCTTDVVNETVEEKPVSGAVSETTRLMRGKRTVTMNRNQQEKAELGTANSVRNERTEGGLWNQTITTFARILGWFRKTCRKTMFLHEHAETEVVESDPGFEHVTEAGGGVVTEKSVARNDEGGFDVETRTREEQSVPGAVVEARKFIDGVQLTTVNRGQRSAASAAGLKIGESVRNEITEGGLVDQTIVQASVEPVGRTGEACENNALVHAHSRTEGMGTQPQQAEVPQRTGQIATRRVRMTDRGAWEVTDETRTAKPAEAEAQGGAQGRRLEVKSLRNQAGIAPEEPGVNEEVEVSVQRNEFGLVDGTVRRVKHEEMEETAKSGNMLVDEERTQKLNTQERAEYTPQRGTVYDASAQPNGMGARNMTVVKRVAKPALEAKEWTDTQRSASRTITYQNRIVVFRNQEEVPDFKGWETCSPSISINEFGLLDGVLHLRRLVSDVPESGSGSGGQGGTREGNTKKVVKYYQKRDGKLYRREYTVHYDMCWGGSEAWLAAQAAEQRTGGTVRGSDFPELGCISGMRGQIMIIYTGVDEGTETEVAGGSGS